MISRQNKFIFIHVPKVAGQSITRALRPHVLPPHKQVVQRVFRTLLRHKKHDFYRIYPGGGHGDAEAHRTILGQDVYDGCYSFGFVRNPWDRMISLRSFVSGRPHEALYEVAKTGTVTDFLSAAEDHGVRQQIDFLSDRQTGELIVNRVGRFERLSEDLHDICDTLGIKVDLPHKNASARDNDFRRYFNDTDCETVARICDRDIAAFGYRFDPE